jgi:hypothetical protein
MHVAKLRGSVMDVRDQAKAKRELAARARSWAKSLSLKADRNRLERHAEELEREAAELERQAATAIPVTPSRTVMTQQQQQQQETDPKPTDSKDENHKPQRRE